LLLSSITVASVVPAAERGQDRAAVKQQALGQLGIDGIQLDLADDVGESVDRAGKLVRRRNEKIRTDRCVGIVLPVADLSAPAVAIFGLEPDSRGCFKAELRSALQFRIRCDFDRPVFQRQVRRLRARLPDPPGLRRRRVIFIADGGAAGRSEHRLLCVRCSEKQRCESSRPDDNEWEC
jgi:hypothetical protein